MQLPFGRIRVYSILVVVVLIGAFALVSLILIWGELQISESKDRNAEFHVPTIIRTAKITKLLGRLEESIRADIADLDHHAIDLSGRGHLMQIHGQRMIYTVSKELASIADLQASFGGARFEKTLERIADEFEGLSAALSNEPPTLQFASLPKELKFKHLKLSALILSIEQLEKLHVISYDEVNQLLGAQIRNRNVVVLPAAVVILLIAIIGLRYLTSQTRNALNRLQESDRALQSLNMELEQRVEARTAELRAAQSELVRKERLAAVGQVTATVSHELRNPLGAIRSATDAIKRFTSGKEPQLDRALALLERGQVRCDKIIEDLLNFTRVRDLNLSVTNLDDWLEDHLAEYEFPENIALRRDLGAGIEISLDRDRLERAVRNVIDNACHAMTDDGEESAMARSHRLIVAARAVEQRLEVSIKDNGPGISAEEQAKVFEPLYSTKSFGVGLGLPMVKQIMEQHSGGIEITSELGSGTEVVLWLPRSVPEKGEAA